MQEYIKHLLIATPLEKPAERMRSLLRSRRHRQYPELAEIYMEPLRTEKMMQHAIGKAFNCIDVGCHLGSTLSTILKLAPHGHHMAFEPVPYKARWLKQKFPKVDVRQVALGDKPGEVTFYYNPTQSGFSGLRQHLVEREKIQEFVVRCECLDEVLPSDRRVDFMKLDVEGGELAVLQGAAEILRCYRPTLLFECTSSGLSSFGFTSTQIFEFLTQQHSYSVLLLKDFLSDGESLDLEQFDTALKYPFQAFNFVAVAN